MVSGLLRNAGVYLGEDGDFLRAQKGENDEGFLEHFGFYALNEKLLAHLGAGWDMPDLPAGWESRKDLDPFREDARQLIGRMGKFANGAGAWGWKDPRNSLTIQFWRGLAPDCRVVVCVRNPLEVAASLQRRNNFSMAAAARLWLCYYRNLLDHVPADKRVVTCYENYFDDSAKELKRVLAGLGLPAAGELPSGIFDSIKPALRHQWATGGDLRASELSPEVIDLYAQLCAEAEGASAAPCAQSANGQGATAVIADDTSLLRSRFHAETAQREEHIRQLTGQNGMLRESLAALEKKIEAMRKEQEDQARELEDQAREREEHARRFTAMAERAVAVHGLIAQKRAQFAFLQVRVESTLKDTKPLLPRFVRFSNSVNSIYRIFKRIRKVGKLFTLQRELNDAVSESLGTLTHVTTILAGHRPAGTETVPPGLELYAYEKTNVDVPELMDALRIRLS